MYVPIWLLIVLGVLGVIALSGCIAFAWILSTLSGPWFGG